MTSLQGITPEHLDRIEAAMQADQQRIWRRGGTSNATVLSLCTALRLAWRKLKQAQTDLAYLTAIPLDVPASIRQAVDLVRGLYASSYISIAQMGPIVGALDEADLTIAAYQRAHAMLTQQLDGRDAEAAAQALAIEQFLSTCPCCKQGFVCSADSHQVLRAALDPEAGQALRRLIGECAEQIGDPDLHPPNSTLHSLAIKLLPYRKGTPHA